MPGCFLCIAQSMTGIVYFDTLLLTNLFKKFLTRRKREHIQYIQYIFDRQCDSSAKINLKIKKH